MAHKYNKVEQQLREFIVGELAAGDALASERRLATQFGVSRVTIRTALARLEEDGLVTRLHGSGTYKADAVLVGQVSQPTSFWSDMQQRGHEPSYRILEVAERNAGESVGGALSIPHDERIVSIRRLLLADGEPMAIEQAYLPLARCPGILSEDLARSLYDLMKHRYGLTMHSTRRRVGAVNLDEDEARLLGTEPGAAALIATGTTADPYGIPMEHFVTRFRADRYELDMTVRVAR